MTDDPRSVEIARLSEVLANLRGATATVWEYTASHETLTLRFQHPTKTGNTHLVCRGCRRIELSPHWLHSEFEASEIEPKWILLVDKAASARIECRLVGVQHDVEPNYWRDRPPSSAS
jgi:hypothetical protein